jgi:hypothetical protein
MANDAPLLSTTELRRRLYSPPRVPAALEPTPAAPPARTSLPRLTIPAALADLPIAEDAPTFPITDETDEEPALLAEPTPLPLARFTPTDLRRPATRISDFIPRAMLALSPVAREPVADPLTDQLRRDNAQLQELMQEMRQLLQDASEQEQRVQAELVERDARLATSEARIVELETIVNTKPKTKNELEEWADDLERESFQITQERRVLEDERRQLRDDEEALEKQMREMEVGMARERAVLARQETELKRLNGEIQHELELMQRGDGNLRDRLAVFQRRHAEVVSSTAGPSNGHSYATFALPVALPVTPLPTPKKNDTTGILRKLFRSGE